MGRWTYFTQRQSGGCARHKRANALLALLACVTTLLTCQLSVAELRYQVELFTTRAHPPLNPNAVGEQTELTVYLLDGLARLNVTLSHQLPPQAKVATAMAAKRLGALTENQQADLRESATGLLAAHRYGLTRYPAMVINGEAVIYGLTDPAEAVRQYRRWRGEVEL